jgi:quinoprotein glucose dehydrogenase
MKNLLGILVLGLLLSGNAYAQNFKFTKIINLDKPWGSSFINNKLKYLSEKPGKGD